MAIPKGVTLKKKIEYIYDYYKWPIILGLTVIICLSWFLVDKLTEKKYDFYLSYVGKEYFEKDYEENILSLAELGEDITGDGEKTLYFDQFNYVGLFDSQYFMTMTITIENMIKKGERTLFIIDKDRLDLIIEDVKEYILPVNEWDEEEPDGKVGIQYAKSLKGSKALTEKGINADDLYVFVTRKAKSDKILENSITVARKLVIKDE